MAGIYFTDYNVNFIVDCHDLVSFCEFLLQ